MTDQEATYKEAAKLLCQLVQVQLAINQVERQLQSQGFGENGPYWRRVRAILQDKEREINLQLAHYSPSGTFRPWSEKDSAQ